MNESQKSAGATILGSLLCLPNLFPGLTLPKNGSTITMEVFKESLKDTLLESLQVAKCHLDERQEMVTKAHRLFLCNIAVLVFEELTVSSYSWVSLLLFFSSFFDPEPKLLFFCTAPHLLFPNVSVLSKSTWC